ncbi:MAG: GntR family transcriptional repressor for pyruvate dehydrogenase complex [Candidatus Azotimanducaceae bacterium]|jgi:GntR family transcriptional repressor for pyruvate dehydrogenase complex
MTDKPQTAIRSKVEDICDILRDEILSGQYRPTERLPSERDLSARFDANRGAVREALKKLEQLGITTITPGGVRVVPIEDASLSILGPLVDLQKVPNPVLVGQLLEVLGALLSMAARTAIERASADELTEMRNIVGKLIKNVNDSESQHQGWRELATLFAKVSNNLVLRLILNGLKAQITNRLEARRSTDFPFDYKQREETLNKLSQGLLTRDSTCVAATIQEHFDRINTNIQNISNASGSISNE